MPGTTVGTQQPAGDGSAEPSRLDGVPWAPKGGAMGDGRLRALLRTGQSGEKTVHLCGELDLVTADQGKAALLEAVSVGGPPITVDVAQLTFIDAAGVRAIVAGQEAARIAGQELNIERARGVVELVLSVLGFINTEPAPARGRKNSDGATGVWAADRPTGCPIG